MIVQILYASAQTVQMANVLMQMKAGPVSLVDALENSTDSLWIDPESISRLENKAMGG